jgi:hypothetical protein
MFKVLKYTILAILLLILSFLGINKSHAEIPVSLPSILKVIAGRAEILGSQRTAIKAIVDESLDQSIVRYAILAWGYGAFPVYEVPMEFHDRSGWELGNIFEALPIGVTAPEIKAPKNLDTIEFWFLTELTEVIDKVLKARDSQKSLMQTYSLILDSMLGVLDSAFEESVTQTIIIENHIRSGVFETASGLGGLRALSSMIADMVNPEALHAERVFDQEEFETISLCLQLLREKIHGTSETSKKYRTLFGNSIDRFGKYIVEAHRDVDLEAFGMSAEERERALLKLYLNFRTVADQLGFQIRGHNPNLELKDDLKSFLKANDLVEARQTIPYLFSVNNGEVIELATVEGK